MPTNIKYAEYVNPVVPGTPEMEALLMPAYQLTVKEAKRLVKLHETDPTHVPWDVYKKADAFLEAYKTKAGLNAKLASEIRRPETRRVRNG